MTKRNIETLLQSLAEVIENKDAEIFSNKLKIERLEAQISKYENEIAAAENAKKKKPAEVEKRGN